MRPFQAFKHSLQQTSSTSHIAHPQSIALSAQPAPDQTGSRHDALMLTARSVSADPYAAWLQQRKADREREAHSLNPRASWDDLRSFCVVARS
jgi:hypothetical protein